MAVARIGQWEWVPEPQELRGFAAVVRLTELEARLLDFLVAHPGEVVPHETLLREVWEYSQNVQSRAVSHTLARLRKKLGPEGDLIVTVYGKGVRLELQDADGLVGRGPLLREARDLMEQHRCLALYGVGGVGKTTLARALVPEPALWLPCESLGSVESLTRALGRALELEPGPLSRGVLRVALRRAPIETLVLDGAENLAGECASLAREWRDESMVRVVVTTRRQTWELPALLVPPLDPDAAARLFVERAAQIQAGDVHPQEEVLRVVELVQGVPLGLELAAARLRVLRLAEILGRLERDVRVLGTGDGGVQAVLEGTWSMLGPAARSALTALALFPGAATLDGLQAVTAQDEYGLLDALDELVRAAVVIAERPAFRLLDLVRRFARPRVGRALVERFVTFCASRADLAYDLVYTQPGPALALLDAESPSWLAALDHATVPEQRAALALAVRTHDVVRGIAQRTDGVIDGLDVDALTPSRRVDVLNARTGRPTRGVDAEDQRRLADEALALSRELDDPVRLVETWARALNAIWLSEGTEAALAAAEPLVAVLGASELPPVVEGLAWLTIAWVAQHGDRLATSVQSLERAVPLLGDRPDLLARAVRDRASVLLKAGRVADAAAAAADGLSDAREQGNLTEQLLTGTVLCQSLAEAGDVDRAVDVLERTQRLASELGATRAVHRLTLLSADLLDDGSQATEALTRVRDAALADGLPGIGASACLLAGYRRHVAGDLPAALASYERALQLTGRWAPPVLAHAWCGLARAEAGEDPGPHVAHLRPAHDGVDGWISEVVSSALERRPAPPARHLPVPREVTRTTRLAERLEEASGE